MRPLDPLEAPLSAPPPVPHAHLHEPLPWPILFASLALY